MTLLEHRAIIAGYPPNSIVMIPRDEALALIDAAMSAPISVRVGVVAAHRHRPGYAPVHPAPISRAYAVCGDCGSAEWLVWDAAGDARCGQCGAR